MDTSKSINDPWSVIHYEVTMYWGTRKAIDIVSKLPDGDVIRNAVVESLILHTRILTDILLSKGKSSDDILLKNIMPDWVMRDGHDMLQQSRNAYGKTNIPNSPCWVINKMLAHPTILRTNNFDYSVTLNKIEPIIFKILHALSTITRRPRLFPYE